MKAIKKQIYYKYNDGTAHIDYDKFHDYILSLLAIKDNQIIIDNTMGQINIYEKPKEERIKILCYPFEYFENKGYYKNT